MSGDHGPQTRQDVQTRDLRAESVDTWLEIDRTGTVTVYAGKVELGTGVRTALAQIVAEELDVAFDRVNMVLGDTALTPDQGVTAGSKTLQVAGTRLRQAASHARHILLDQASDILGVPADALVVDDGVISAPGDPNRTVTYGDLAREPFGEDIPETTQVKSTSAHSIVGTSVSRTDLPSKLFGGVAYVHDIVLEDMLHGRVVRPHVRTAEGVGSEIEDVDDSALQDMMNATVVRNGNFLGVVADREEVVIAAAEALEVTWSDAAELPHGDDIWQDMQEGPTDDQELVNDGDVDDAFGYAATTHQAVFEHPYQAHASLGPSCAVADVRLDRATIWSSSQGVYPLRPAIAQLLEMPIEQVRIIFAEGAGCYGQNGADDVSADAALLSQAVGRPVRVQWSRQDEFAWEPKGPAMTSDVRAGLDVDGNVVAWDYQVWTPTHANRPQGEPSRLLAGRLIDPPFTTAPKRNVGGDRNAPTTYTFPNNRVTAHWVEHSPIHQSSFRTLGGLHNSTANEVFMDELAMMAGADPIEFRIRHLDDPRAIAVIERVADAAGWNTPRATTSGTSFLGRGVAFTRYETEYAYVATVADVEVDTESGDVRVTRVVVAHDCGQIVNPDGVINQVEGNVIQGISRALKEEVTWDESEITSLTWDSYPILTFGEVPEIEVVLINRPDEPSWGAGEPATCPMIAAINNAIFDAAGVRLRRTPYTTDRVLDAFRDA